MTDVEHYSYQVLWSSEDEEFVATVAEFPSLSWLNVDQTEALQGLVGLVTGVIADLEARGESIPESIAERRFSGRFVQP